LKFSALLSGNWKQLTAKLLFGQLCPAQFDLGKDSGATKQKIHLTFLVKSSQSLSDFKMEMICMENNDMKKEEITFVEARTLSKVNSQKNSSKKTACKPDSTDDKTGHRNPDTGHYKKEIGPGGKHRSCQFRVSSFPITQHAKQETIRTKRETPFEPLTCGYQQSRVFSPES
jgi:hypothetical protein